ncbi:MAG: hypothetical protein ABN482_03630 [Corticimicrobacter sp.]|uniref:hypothetical protein n=1 Tax=Corticimicrobacter sp. TaxID=2678536 RepID=UPI0032DAE938
MPQTPRTARSISCLLLGCLATLIILGGCSRNVRWSHPTPSKELIAQALTDLHGYHAYGSYDVEDNSLLAEQEARRLLANPALLTDTTPEFKFINVSGNTIEIIGFTKFFCSPDKNRIDRRCIYHYKGEVTGARYSLPHMAPNIDALKLATRPLLLEVRLITPTGEQVSHPAFDGTLSLENDQNQRYNQISAFVPPGRGRPGYSIF